MRRITFGEWLKTTRKARGLSQERLADAMEIDRSYVVKVETGKVQLPVLDTRARFHKALGTTEDELVALGIVQNDAVAITQTGRMRAEGQPVRVTGGGPLIDEFVGLMQQVQWDERAVEVMRGVLQGLILSSGSPMPSPDPDAP